MRFLGQRENRVCFVGKLHFEGADREVFVFRDAELFDDLVCSDFPEGPESHLSKKQKRALVNSVESLSTMLHDGSKCPSFGTSSLEQDQLVNEPEGLQETRKEPNGPIKKEQEPKSQQEKIDEPVSRRSFRSLDSSSPELSALGLSELRPCSHDDFVANLAKEKPKIIEIFLAPRVTPVAARQGLKTTEPANLDLKSGWNALDYGDRQKMWRILEEQAPDVVILSPECKMFSQLMNINLRRIPIEKLTKEQMEALVMWQLCLQVADFQLQKGRFFIIEQPAGASSWRTHGFEWLLKQKGVLHFLFDQCELGLSVDKKGGLSRKSTGLATNHLGVAFLLSQFQCRQQHSHVHLESGLPRKAQVYPKDMVEIIVKGLETGSSSFSGAVHEGHAIMDEEEVEIGGEDMVQPRAPGTIQRDLSIDLTEEQKRKVELMHNNMGHISREQMLSMLKAAGAKEGVLKYVKDKFHCPSCVRQRKPVERRHAAIPRTFQFNRIIGLDFFFLSFDNRTYAFLNAVCHGTNFQQVGLLKNYDGGVPSSQETWRLFHRIWIQPFGIPETILCDGGSEFKQAFERSAEQFGLMQIITDAASPWQNGRVERHGGWVKDRAEMEINSGQTVLVEVSDLEGHGHGRLQEQMVLTRRLQPMSTCLRGEPPRAHRAFVGRHLAGAWMAGVRSRCL